MNQNFNNLSRDPGGTSARNVRDPEAAIRAIFAGTAGDTGAEFFALLVKNLALALGTAGAWVTEYDHERRRLRALAFWYEDHYIEGYEYAIAGTPCEPVIDKQELLHFPDEVVSLFPGDPDLEPLRAVSYIGMPFTDREGKIVGHLAVLDTKPMLFEPQIEQVFRIFAARAAAELLRLKAEATIRASEERLTRLVNSAMDAIIELDSNRIVTRMNQAAAKTFGIDVAEAVGIKLGKILSAQSETKLKALAADLKARPQGRQSLWIPGGLQCRCRDGAEFPAEATFSRFEFQNSSHYTLILRNIHDRIESERRIEALSTQTEYLQEEIREFYDVSEIVGESEPIRNLLTDLVQVAPTNASVLISGETGTGKELVARAIHAAGSRSDQTLVKVNCAALPENLIESELFGHQKGAFTGATEKRVGRFTLADGGTIFLDEIGELPLQLQAKLLRVLQEGEFEPVGSSTTNKVDVRIIAASNRDLKKEVTAGRFREDLYYRLSVFPIAVPPLRERGNDVHLLAQHILDRLARSLGKQSPVLNRDCQQRLLAYNWPGNVRELQNVLERAMILSRNDELNLAPQLTFESSSPRSVGPSQPSTDDGKPHSAEEMRELERSNLIRALQQTDWKVAGKNGAAQLLGMKPSTLSSRMRALKVTRPR